MFVQVIRGKVSDADRAKQQLEGWVERLGPHAQGWLGSTGGVSDDGTLLLLARFESLEAAQRNSERAEQGEWWAETETVFEGEVTFKDSDRVRADTPGDPGRAGFVQVMQGRTGDPERAAGLMFDDSVDVGAHRPDILGRLLAQHEDGEWTMAIYFTSEEEARAGEQKAMPAELEERMQQMRALGDGPPDFVDLRDPWLHSPT